MMRRAKTVRRGLLWSLSLTVALGASLAFTISGYAAAYDGTDPHATGCDSQASTMRSIAVDDNDGVHGSGYLELRWSGKCLTAWARFTCESNAGPPQCPGTFTISLRRNDGASESVSVFFPNWMGYLDRLYTLQLNDDSRFTAQACYSGGHEFCTASF